MRGAAYLLVWALCSQIARPSAPATIHTTVTEAVTGADVPNCAILFANTDFAALLLQDLPAGSAVLSAECPGRQPVYRTVRLVPDQELTVHFLVPPIQTISGRVIDQNKHPVANVAVWLLRSEYRNGRLRNTTVASQTTPTDGRFAFNSQVESGRAYYLLASPTPHLQTADAAAIEALTYYGDVTSLAAASPVTLLPAEHREALEIKLRRTPSFCVDGRVEVSGQPSVLSLSVFDPPLAGTSVTHRKTYSQDDGAFQFCGLNTGLYRLAPTASETGAGIDFTIADSDLHHLNLSLSTAHLFLQLALDDAATPTPASDLPSASMRVPPGAESLSAEAMRVLRAPPSPKAAVALWGAPDGATRNKSELVPYEGPFSSALPAGDYTIHVQAPAGLYLKRLTFSGGMPDNGMLHLPPEAHATLRLEFSRDGAPLQFKVTDADGNPVPDAIVVLVPDAALAPPLLADLLQQLPTDQEGNCTSETLAPAKYRALALTAPIRLIPEDISKLLALLSQATGVTVLPRTSQLVPLNLVRTK